MGRLGIPSEVAKVIAFLVSEDVSYLSGQVIGVNGGML
jgi:3-oxoacyl-[acyl-carrier protein] reductase